MDITPNLPIDIAADLATLPAGLLPALRIVHPIHDDATLAEHNLISLDDVILHDDRLDDLSDAQLTAIDILRAELLIIAERAAC